MESANELTRPITDGRKMRMRMVKVRDSNASMNRVGMLVVVVEAVENQY